MSCATVIGLKGNIMDRTVGLPVHHEPKAAYANTSGTVSQAAQGHSWQPRPFLFSSAFKR